MPIIKSDFLLIAFLEQSVLNMKNNLFVTLFLFRGLHLLVAVLTSVFQCQFKKNCTLVNYLP